MDWTQALGYIGGGAGMVLIAWMRRESIRARLSAESAAANAETAAANADSAKSNAESAIYTLMVDRLRQVESEVRQLKTESIEKDRRIQSLEQHIFHLENTMRTHGLDPPARAFVIG